MKRRGQVKRANIAPEDRGNAGTRLRAPGQARRAGQGLHREPRLTDLLGSP